MQERPDRAKDMSASIAKRHGLVRAVLGNATVHLCPLRTENNESGPSDMGYRVGAIEGKRAETST